MSARPPAHDLEPLGATEPSRPRPGSERSMLWPMLAAAAAACCCLAAIWLNPAPAVAATMTAAIICIALTPWLARRAMNSDTAGRFRSASLQDASDADLEQVRSEIEEATSQLHRRERALAERLATFHEWMEFPEPIQLGQLSDADADATGVAQARAENELDRRLFALIEEETEKLFNAIRDRKYSANGGFEANVAREDAMALVRRVARLYQPDAAEPLLETSVALILRAVSRASLQLLVVLEQLPLDLKEMSIGSIYRRVQTAVAYYGAYQRAKPYFPWASNAVYFGRFALGANPLTLGAWYATSKLGVQLAKAATERIINQQVLVLIQNVVRLIAFEVAQTYRGDFRQRDPNWVYAAELTHLASGLPASAKTLSLSLAEVGALQLRSEYDRVWFYRCLAAGRSAGDTKAASLGLRAQERLLIANRLERFVDQLPRRGHEAVASWRLDAERRLGIKLSEIEYAGGEAAVEQALRSLGGFLLEVKHRSDNLWLLDLETTDTMALASESLKERLAESPPFMFEYPDLAPGGELAGKYFGDLLRLAAALPHRGVDITMMLEEVAAYLRVEAEALHKQWADALHVELKRVLGERLRGLPAPHSAAAVLDQLDSEGDAARPDALFWPARLEAPPAASTPPVELALLAINGVFSAWDGVAPEPVWEAACESVVAEQLRGVLGSNCLLRLRDSEQPDLMVEGAAWTRYPRYFSPLLKLLG